MTIAELHALVAPYILPGGIVGMLGYGVIAKLKESGRLAWLKWPEAKPSFVPQVSPIADQSVGPTRKQIADSLIVVAEFAVNEGNEQLLNDAMNAISSLMDAKVREKSDGVEVRP